MPKVTSTTKQATSIRTASNFQGVDTRSTFTLVNKFLGYRNREDKTLLAPGYMIPNSQNVLIDITGRLKSRQGFTLDGQANTTLTPIQSWYDWEEHKNGTINLRKYAGNLQFRYVNSLGVVLWTTILSTLSTTKPVRFVNFWNNTEVENVLLFVNGTPNVYEWNGSTTTFASATAATITKQGATTWAEEGFYVTANKQIVIGGITYTYTGGESTTTLTGVTPDPTLGGHVAGDLIYQKVVTTASGSITGLPATMNVDGISQINNQAYYGYSTSNNVYISKINNYKDVSFSSPRIVGEGALVTLRSVWTAFQPQENTMYIAGGKSQWFEMTTTLSADLTNESLTVVPLKTSAKQGAQRQEATTHDRNSIVFVSNEPKLISLGRVDNIYQTPMMTDYSYPVVNDFNFLNTTDSSVAYWKTYIYVAFPRSGVYMILNMTDPTNIFWEAPQTGSFSGFTIIDGELFAHSYSVPETYRLYDSFTDNGAPILSRATFAYNNYGDVANTKYFNEYWTSGYISANTKLVLTLNYDFDGCSTQKTTNILGNNKRIVCAPISDASLGKTGLGKHGLGTNSITTIENPLPPYFNVIKTPARKDFYFLSPTFESYGEDYQWNLLAFGPLVTKTMYGNNFIKEE